MRGVKEIKSVFEAGLSFFAVIERQEENIQKRKPNERCFSAGDKTEQNERKGKTEKLLVLILGNERAKWEQNTR
jgi:hypothetical protein